MSKNLVRSSYKVWYVVRSGIEVPTHKIEFTLVFI